MYADIFPHLFPIFFMRHFDCNPLQFDLHLVFYIFKWNSIICISNWKSQIRNLKSLVKWSSNLKSFKLGKISGFNLELTTTISALLPGGLGGDFFWIYHPLKKYLLFLKKSNNKLLYLEKQSWVQIKWELFWIGHGHIWDRL